MDITELNALLGVTTYNLATRKSKRKRTVLLMGRIGTGKTFQIHRLRRAGFKPFYMNMEDGQLSLEGSDIVAVDCHSYSRFKAILDKLLEARAKKIDVSSLIDTIVVDSAKTFIEYLLDYLVVEENKLRAEKKLAPLQAEGLHEYFLSSKKLEAVFKWIRDLPFNFVFLTLEEYDKNKEGDLLWMPAMYKGARAKFMQYTDGVFRMYKNDDGSYWMQTAGTSDVDAKIRMPIDVETQEPLTPPPLFISNPDLSQIFKYWNREIDYPWEKSNAVTTITNTTITKDDDDEF